MASTHSHSHYQPAKPQSTMLKSVDTMQDVVCPSSPLPFTPSSTPSSAPSHSLLSKKFKLKQISHLILQLTALKSLILSRSPSTPTRATLPLELIYTILDLLPPPTAWRLRAVNRTFKEYVEHHLSLHWLEGTRIDMLPSRPGYQGQQFGAGQNQAIFRIHPASCEPGNGRASAYAFPYLRREGKWLVYALHPHQSLREGAVQRPSVPLLHPLAYVAYAREREAQTPRYTYHLRRLEIHMTVTHIAGGFHTGPPVILRSKWHPKVMRGAVAEGFRLCVERDEVWVDWRVLFGGLWVGGTQQWDHAGVEEQRAAQERERRKRRRQSSGSEESSGSSGSGGRAGSPESAKSQKARKNWEGRRSVYVVRAWE